MAYQEELDYINKKYQGLPASASAGLITDLKRKYGIKDTSSPEQPSIPAPAKTDTPEVAPAPALGTAQTPNLTPGMPGYVGSGVPGTAPSTTAPASKYDENYYTALRKSILGEATSPEWSQYSQQLRSQLAGKGILSGSAYDTAQAQRLENLQYTADKAVAEAQIQAPEREKQDLQTKLSLLEQYKDDPKSSGYTQYWDTLNQLVGLYGGTQGTLTAPSGSTGKQLITQNQDAINTAKGSISNASHQILLNAFSPSNKSGNQPAGILSAYDDWQTAADAIESGYATQEQINTFTKYAPMWRQIAQLGPDNWGDSGYYNSVKQIYQQYYPSTEIPVSKNQSAQLPAQVGGGDEVSNTLAGATRFQGPYGDIISAKEYQALDPFKRMQYKPIG